MAELDINQEALRQVREATEDSDPVTTEELLASPELRRQLAEAEERLKSEPPPDPLLVHANRFDQVRLIISTTN